MAVATKNAISKIYDRYIELKNKDSDKIYLFLCGNFYIALDSDAIILNELFGMKLTKFSNLCDKCGFPKNSIEKYINIFNEHNIKYEIIENKDKIDIIKEKVSVDINSMSNEELKNIITNIKKLILE